MSPEGQRLKVIEALSDATKEQLEAEMERRLAEQHIKDVERLRNYLQEALATLNEAERIGTVDIGTVGDVINLLMAKMVKI